MSGYLSIPVMVVVVIVQATVMPQIALFGGTPDLVLLVVLAWSLMAGYERGLVWAIVGGIAQDLISAVPLGTTSLALVIVVTIAAFFIGQINPRSVFTPAAAAGGLTLVAHLVSQGVLLATGRQLPILDLLLSVTLPTMLYNGVVMVLVYRLIGAFYLAGRPQRVEGLS